MQITSKQGQWLGDITVREAGSIESLVTMAIDNEISITDKMSAGSPVVRPVPSDRRVINYYDINNIHPATYMDADSGFGGIGFMAIEINFTVS
jgi:hypothetical protein